MNNECGCKMKIGWLRLLPVAGENGFDGEEAEEEDGEADELD